jgi:hypothetical protein
MLENTARAIQIGQSRETGNIRYPRNKTKKSKVKIQYNMCWTPPHANNTMQIRHELSHKQLEVKNNQKLFLSENCNM